MHCSPGMVLAQRPRHEKPPDESGGSGDFEVGQEAELRENRFDFNEFISLFFPAVFGIDFAANDDGPTGSKDPGMGQERMASAAQLFSEPDEIRIARYAHQRVE